MTVLPKPERDAPSPLAAPREEPVAESVAARRASVLLPDSAAALRTSEPVPEPVADSLGPRALRFVRALIVGGGASLSDFSVFTVCVRALGVSPAAARLPALLVGASFQFFGSRHYAFRARSGNLTRQALLFSAFEVISVALNWAAFQFLLPRLSFWAPELVTIVTSSAIFVLYNYPTRRLIIFRLEETRS